MKLLAFTDIHADMNLLRKLVKRAQKNDIDVVVCAGDFSIFENHAGAVLKEMNKMGKPIVIIPGNHETPQRLEHWCNHHKNFKFVHKGMWRFEEFVFVGWGTDGFSLRNTEMRKTAREWQKQLKKDDKIVMVTHQPPHGTKLDDLDGQHVGNIDIRNAIERIKPKLYICGHLHENAGKMAKLGVTTMVNPGWAGKVIEI